jgi:hypothetical protein
MAALDRAVHGSVPFVLETPKDGHASDVATLKRLRGLRG